MVRVADFIGCEGADKKDVKMGARDERGIVGVAPGLGVEMEAENEVGLDGLVDELGAGTDLGGAIKKAIGVAAGGIGVVGGVLGGEGGEVFRTQWG